MVEEFSGLEELDFTGQIVMVTSDEQAAMIFEVPKAGVLMVTEDPHDQLKVYIIFPGPILKSFWRRANS